ncbi:MAG: 6-phosphogluconolactonase [Burkholderiaceae bacterium]
MSTLAGEVAAVRWIGVSDIEELQRIACQRILDAATHAIESRGRFVIVLSGGETPRGVYRMLRTARTDWSRWHVYFGDERCVPAGDAARNSTMACDEWLDHVPLPQPQVHAIPAALGATAAARAYSETLRALGDFDLVLLGLGEDGHTASLFAGHNWGIDPNAPDVLAVFDAPKPPPQRVSMSAARLSRAREVLFLVADTSKREALARWRSGAPLPAAAIRPAAGVDVLFESSLLDHSTSLMSASSA